MEHFPGEREAKRRLRERGIDIEQSYREMQLQIAGAKAPEILSRVHPDQEPLDPEWVKETLRQDREFREQQRTEARRLWALGNSCAQIAARLGVSQQSIRNWTR